MIALATTTITISRARSDADPYDTPVVRPVADGIRATIGSPSGRDRIIGGHQTVVDAKLNCDPCELGHSDLVTDDTTGITYQVMWRTLRVGLGLDHLEAGLNVVEGYANA